HVPQPHPVDDVPHAAGQDQESRRHPQGVPDDPAEQDHRHRDHNDGGDRHQQPAHTGEAGPGRPVVVDGPQLYQPGQKGLGIPQ
ncbi:hypothetical protein GMJFJA_GMJFJA_14345, partial [Dysosmobacter welbionis]